MCEDRGPDSQSFPAALEIQTAIKLGFEALGGTELADPWGFFRPFTLGKRFRKSSLLEQFLRMTTIS